MRSFLKQSMQQQQRLWLASVCAVETASPPTVIHMVGICLCSGNCFNPHTLHYGIRVAMNSEVDFMLW